MGPICATGSPPRSMTNVARSSRTRSTRRPKFLAASVAVTACRLRPGFRYSAISVFYGTWASGSSHDRAHGCVGVVLLLDDRFDLRHHAIDFLVGVVEMR